MLAHPRGGSSVDILTTDREEQFLKVIAWDLRDSGGRKDVDWTITVKEGEGALEEILSCLLYTSWVWEEETISLPWTAARHDSAALSQTRRWLMKSF